MLSVAPSDAGPSLFSNFTVAGLRVLWELWSATSDADCVATFSADPSGVLADLRIVLFAPSGLAHSDFYAQVQAA